MEPGPAEEEQFGPYLVYERLGVGGMATVHRALERGIEGFERMVALKRLLPHLAEDASFIKSFVREAKLASQLNHVNIVQIYELGRVGTEYFISMEYIEGRDVRRVLRHARKVTGPPAIHVTVGLLLQLCEALDYAHTKSDEEGQPLKLVHRDISPSNLLVTPAGHVKVIDFGIAKAQSSQLRTQTGRVKGKLAYMAPEAITGGRELDARSDLWAVGVIAHELLTARPLFASKNEYQTLLKVQRGDIIPPSTFNQACPPELDAIVQKALAREPDERYANAAEMRDALLDLRRRYTLQTGHRDIAGWLDWAFSVEAPTGGFAGNTNERSNSSFEMSSSQGGGAPKLRGGGVMGQRPPAREDDEAVEIAWGGAEAEDLAGPVVLDDIPDVSGKHLAPPASDARPRADDDIPPSQPNHGQVSRKSMANIAVPPTAAESARAASPIGTRTAGRSDATVMGRPSARGATPPPRGGDDFVDALAALGVDTLEGIGPGDDATQATVSAIPGDSDDLDFPMVRPARLARAQTPAPVARPATRATPTPTGASRVTPMPTVPMPARGATPPAGPPARMSASLLGGGARATGSHAPVRATPLPLPAPATTPPPTKTKPDSGVRPTPVAQAPVDRSDIIELVTPSRNSPMPAAPMRAAAVDSDRLSIPSLHGASARIPAPNPADADAFAIDIDIDSTGAPERLSDPTLPSVRNRQARASDAAAAIAAKYRDRALATVSIGQAIADRGKPKGGAWKILVGLVVLGGAGAAVAVIATRGDAKAAPDDKTAAAPTAAKTTGTLKFAIEPRDSSITIEGSAKHDGSPWSIELPAGSHNVTIEHEGYKPYLVAVDLEVDDKQSLRVVLEPLDKNATATSDATLIVGSTPDGLELAIDGKPTGQHTPLRTPLAPGAHDITLLRNGAVVWHHPLVAKANSVSELNASLAKPQVAIAQPGASRVERTQAPRPVREPGAATPDAKPDDGEALPPAAATTPSPVTTPPAPPIAPPPTVTVTPPPPLVPAPVAVPHQAGPITVAPNRVSKLSGDVPHLSVGKASAIPATVAAKLCVDAAGRVTSVEVLTKLERAAASDLADAMHDWRYAPVKDHGVAVPACFAVAFRTK